MDDFTDDQYGRLLHGGNQKWSDYWDIHRNDKESDGDNIRYKYESDAARAYRETLSLHTKSCQLSHDGMGCGRQPISPKPTSTPSIEAPLQLPEDPSPSFQELYNQSRPFAMTMFRSAKTKLFILAGLSSAVGLRCMGGVLEASNTYNYYNLLVALGIAIFFTVVPCIMFHQFAKKIANGLLNNRQEAFKSARNLLIDKIAKGRAQRMQRCDVYYPLRLQGEPLKARYGIIFFPGALVDRTAYAPIASRLSEMGILVAVANNEPYRVIVKLDGYPIKEEVLHILSDSVLCSNRGTWTVKDWALGGHSMVNSS